MHQANSANKKYVRFPVLIGLLIVTAVFTALITLLIARFWLFQPAVEPVTLDSREQVELEKKLAVLQDRRAPYREHAQDRVIYLTERELNSIIARDPQLAGRMALHLSQDRIKATLLVEVPEDMPVLTGKTVEVTAGLRVEYVEDRPVVIIEGVSLMGVPVPEAWLGGLKGQDLVRMNGPGTKFWEIFSEGIEDLRVEQGRLRIELAE